MDFEREKPGPKPFPWHPDLGVAYSSGHWVPKKCHSILRKEDFKRVLEKMALDPQFEVQVISLLNNNTDQKH